MPKQEVAPTRVAADALTVLGAQIRLARHEKNWTATDLGKRIGVGPRTVTSLEKGRPGVAVGTVFSAASVLGVALFGANDDELTGLRRHSEQRLALIPSREYQPHPKGITDDDGLDF